MENQSERQDYILYSGLHFDGDTLDFYLRSLKYYEQLLDADIKAIQNDSDLAFLFSKPERGDLELYVELAEIKKRREIVEQKLASGSDAWGYTMSLYHGDVRLLKSVGLLFIQRLRNRRNDLASRSRLSKQALMSVDRKISYYEEKTNLGVLRDATTRPLLVGDLLAEADRDTLSKSQGPQANAIQTVLIDSIEILDSELKARCLDLFHSFQQSGQHDRLDTVVSEATRILEDRLRAASGAPRDCAGVDLATFAFGGKSPKLLASDVPAEQDAVHLLFRGTFGFIRNPAHHQLIKTLLPERVLQIVAMVDYLILLVQDAQPGSAALPGQP